MKSFLRPLLLMAGLAWIPAAALAAETTTRTLVERVLDLGPQFTSNTVHALGMDVAYSIPLAAEEKRSLWVFGDTWTGTYDDQGTSIIGGMPTNTMAIVSDRDARDGLKTYTFAVDNVGTACAQLRFLPQEEMERLKDGTISARLWPMHGISFRTGAGGSKVVLFYSIEKLLDGFEPPANFKHMGTGIATAVIRPNDKTPPVFERITRNGDPILWGADDPVVGTSVIKGQDGAIYVYASGREGTMPVVFVAKVDEKTVTQPDAYRWFAGFNGQNPRYAGKLKEAKSLFAGPPTELSVSYSPYLRKYLAVHTMILGPDLVLRTAPRPEGPWSEAEVFHRPKGADGRSFFYAAKEHPWLSRDLGQTLYVTYIDFSEYWPHLLEVRLR